MILFILIMITSYVCNRNTFHLCTDNVILYIYEGSKIIGTFTVTESINPILDASAEKWICIDGRDIHTLNDFYKQIEQKLIYKTDLDLCRKVQTSNRQQTF